MPSPSPAPVSSVVDAIGNTPLIRLARASEATGCEIWGKAEFMNPGGSVKDRAALEIIRDAERAGALRPGGLIVEGTAGNTGIGLAMVGRALGYRTLVVMPKSQAQEKKDAVRLAGAELVEAEPVPYADPRNYQHVSRRLAEERAATEPNGAVWANQFDNVANRTAHYRTTGPEIWDQTGGRIDGFVCAIGTGGTLAGVAAALRERRADVKIGLADPAGSAMFSHFTTGELKSTGESITEGIGQGRVTGNLEGLAIDHAWQVSDAEALEVVFDLVQQEGLCIGGSAGVNVAGAIRMARALGPDHTIVTILCDGGARYASKLFNPAFLAERGLADPALDVKAAAMDRQPQDPLVSTEWLAERLDAPDIRVVDATWLMPGSPGDAKADYELAHIPGAVFFDIDEIADTDSALPHMLPSAAKFASRVKALGLGDGSRIVVYDQSGLMSAARVWWTFRVMGHKDVTVLDGGLPRWIAQGRPVDDREPPNRDRHFSARLDHSLVRDRAGVERALASGGEQLVDARPASRFTGEAAEPRAGLRGGHMPGARSVPSSSLFAPDGTMLPAPELERLFADAGVDVAKPVVTSCGSGVTACLLALALARLGRWRTAVYDGSWTEWGAEGGGAVVQGPA